MKLSFSMLIWTVAIALVAGTGAVAAEPGTTGDTVAETSMQRLEAAGESPQSCEIADDEVSSAMQPMGFGPHCSDPWTCTIQEPGLGFGCTCTYRCSCAICHGELTPINCVLIDNGGCLACPM